MFTLFRSGGETCEKRSSVPATQKTLHTALSGEAFLDISDTHTVHHSLALCQSLLCPVILNSKNTLRWNIDFLSNFCSLCSWMLGKDSILRSHPSCTLFFCKETQGVFVCSFRYYIFSCAFHYGTIKRWILFIFSTW